MNMRVKFVDDNDPLNRSITKYIGVIITIKVYIITVIS